MDGSGIRNAPWFSDDPDPAVPRQIFPTAADPYLARLRRWFELDRRILGADTDLERVRAVCASVHGRWTHSNDDEPTHEDAITILEEAARGKRFRCVQFGIVLAGALAAFGIPARVVAMMSRDVETRERGASHVVAEAWLGSFGKWALFDAQENASVLREGIPLSAAEVAQHIGAPDLEVRLPGLPPGVDPRAYLGPHGFGDNFYYLQTRVDQRRDTPEQSSNERDFPSIMLVPMGALEPQVFQRLTPFQNVTYTRSRRAFYSPPG